MGLSFPHESPALAPSVRLGKRKTPGTLRLARDRHRRCMTSISRNGPTQQWARVCGPGFWEASSQSCALGPGIPLAVSPLGQRPTKIPGKPGKGEEQLCKSTPYCMETRRMRQTRTCTLTPVRLSTKMARVAVDLCPDRSRADSHGFAPPSREHRQPLPSRHFRPLC